MDLKFLHNYHSHSFRCGHAYGEDREYVEAALGTGFKTIGFSDHVILPGIYQPRIRGDFSLLEGYIASVKSLALEYKGRIDVKLAFECEYLGEPFDSYYGDLLRDYGFDYLILGQHCFYDSNLHKLSFYDAFEDRLDRLKKYESDVIAGMESGLFLYFAHPDFFVMIYENWDEHCENTARHICETAQRLHIPLELNMGRTRGKNSHKLWDKEVFMYPYPRFWEIVSEYDIDVVVGIDAHSPEDYFTSNYEAFAKILQDLNLKFLPNNEMFGLRK